MHQAYVLIADISGSTRLYEERGNADARGSIEHSLQDMHELISREEGIFVHSKGDDVLAYFNDAERAFRAALAIVAKHKVSDLPVHAGMSFGTFVEMEADIFGAPVNIASRLADKAKPGELLIDDTCYTQLSAASQSSVQSIGALTLKGVEQPREIFSHSSQGTIPRTRFVPPTGRGPAQSGVTVASSGKTWRIYTGKSLVIGRSPECGIVLGHAWVSRQHATLSVAGALVEFSDHSSMGSLVRVESGEELVLHRNKMLLTGEGVIYAGVSEAARALASITYRVE